MDSDPALQRPENREAGDGKVRHAVGADPEHPRKARQNLQGAKRFLRRTPGEAVGKPIRTSPSPRRVSCWMTVSGSSGLAKRPAASGVSDAHRVDRSRARRTALPEPLAAVCNAFERGRHLNYTTALHTIRLVSLVGAANPQTRRRPLAAAQEYDVNQGVIQCQCSSSLSPIANPFG